MRQPHLLLFLPLPMLLLPILVSLFVRPLAAKVVGTNVIAEPVTPARVARLPAVQQKPWRDYLARSEKQKQADKAVLHAEIQAAATANPQHIPQHAPLGRTGAGLGLNRSADWYLSPEAITIASNLLTWQLPDGGWSKNIDMSIHRRQPGDLYDANNLNRYPDPTDFDKPADPNWHYLATLDNDATWDQIRYLGHVTAALLLAHRAAAAAPFQAAVERGVEYLLHAQYPNGGWPQVWPLEGGYHDAITINDDAMLHAIEILGDTGNSAPDFAYLPVELKHRAAAAANRGLDCLLRLQVIENGRKTVWAQQYDALTLAPTSARNYEMPSLASSESAPIVEYLMQIQQPTPDEVVAVQAAAAWYQRTEIFGYRYGTFSPNPTTNQAKSATSGPIAAPGASQTGAAPSRAGAPLEKPDRELVAAPGAGPIWSRYYDLATNKPIFGDRDKTIHDNVNELSRERRNGYGWYNADGVQVLADYKIWSQTHGK